MTIKLDIIETSLMNDFKESVSCDIDNILDKVKEEKLPVDYFQFYNSISSVYSSRIEGEDIDFDSFFKHKFMNIKYKPDYTKKTDDLVKAYEFAFNNKLNLNNVLEAHSILSKNLLPKSQRGLIRNNPMFVLNNDDRIEYVAAEPNIVKKELEKLFFDIDKLRKESLTTVEALFYASSIHLKFVKIHPLQDGNGRTARLIEKWFLIEKLGDKGVLIGLEKNYYKNLSDYYINIKKLGIEYDELDYSKSLDFLKMTINGLISQVENH
ncbi:MAG: Fic family protein [Bacteroidota bacterium]|nr:Fic family protein [Bacteroidota bacterium]